MLADLVFCRDSEAFYKVSVLHEQINICFDLSHIGFYVSLMFSSVIYYNEPSEYLRFMLSVSIFEVSMKKVLR